ncbi:hypothetical protein SRHO_G00145740 [Serrasalmus rhombeus]
MAHLVLDKALRAFGDPSQAGQPSVTGSPVSPPLETASPRLNPYPSLQTQLRLAMDGAKFFPVCWNWICINEIMITAGAVARFPPSAQLGVEHSAVMELFRRPAGKINTLFTAFNLCQAAPVKGSTQWLQGAPLN